MDILIPNLELPLEERIQLSIYPNGLVVNHSTLDVNNRRKAVALPEHGDLKDVSILLHYLSHMHGATEHDNDLLREFEKMIRECPTVVEATE